MLILNHREEYLQGTAEDRAKLMARVYKLQRHQMWKHEQSGKWIISHAGVELIAAVERLVVHYTVIRMEPDFVVLMGAAHRRSATGEEVRIGQPTFGEASPKNTSQRHPVSISEKRTFDRAILKAVLGEVGGHGCDFYADSEDDDFRAEKPKSGASEAGSGVAEDKRAAWQEALDRANTEVAVAATFRGLAKGMRNTSDDYRALVAMAAARKAEILGQEV